MKRARFEASSAWNILRDITRKTSNPGLKHEGRNGSSSVSLKKWKPVRSVSEVKAHMNDNSKFKMWSRCSEARNFIAQKEILVSKHSTICLGNSQRSYKQEGKAMCEWKHNDKTWPKGKRLVYQFKRPSQSVKVTKSLTRRREKEITPERDSAKKERTPPLGSKGWPKNPQWRKGSE
jgi:hypothetical protein